MTPDEEAAKKAKEEQDAQNTKELEQISKSVKRFAENARVLYLEGHLLLAIKTGEEWEAYALTPHHAKRLSQLFAFQIKNYEAQQGMIPAELDLSIPSTIQRGDLNKPDLGDSAPPSTEPPKPDEPKGKKK